MWHIWLMLCPLTFLSGFVDAIAGGGGLISLPAYLSTGMQIHLAYGSNKFSACAGTIIACIKYGSSGHILPRLGLLAGGMALIGSWMGAQLAIHLSSRMLQGVLLVALPVVAVFLLTNRGFGSQVRPWKGSRAGFYGIGAACGLLIGAYDGFFGPGTGTFLTLAFTGLLGLDLVNASGTAKVVNLASNLAAGMAYFLGGKIWFAVAIPCGACSVLGGFLGARLAVKGGARVIRPVVVIVVALLLGKVITMFFW